MPVSDGKLQRSQQSTVLSKVVGLVSQILAQLRDHLSSCIADVSAKARRPRIAPRPAVHMGSDEIATRERSARLFNAQLILAFKQRMIIWVSRNGFTRGHARSLTGLTGTIIRSA